MRNRAKLYGYLTGLVCATSNGYLLAEQTVQLGMVVSVNSSFYKDVGEEYYILPLAIVEYGSFYLQGIDGGYRFFQDDVQSLAVEIRRTFDGYKADDSDALEGVEDRDPAWEAGLVYETDLLGGQAKAKLMHDISNTHNGSTLRIEYERSMMTGSSYMVSWFAGSEYWSSKKTNYYFGINPEEVMPDRPVYSAGQSYNLFSGINVVKRFNVKYSMIASAEYQWMADEMIESPITSRQDQWSVYAGLFYQF
jgi:outer membrane protein